MKLNQVTLPATDMPASVAFYWAMGFEQIVDAPHYARFMSTEGDATFSVHRVESLPHASETVVYLETSALDETVRDLKAMGFSFSQEPRDEPYLWREARPAAPTGNIICLYWACSNRLNPPWRMRS